MTTMRSPDSPPFVPASPWCGIVIRFPSSTPAGMVSVITLLFSCKPLPPHARHGLSMIVPLPPHVGQVCCTAKKPALRRICPAPWHDGQVLRLAPAEPPVPLHSEHTSLWEKRISFLQPYTASLKSSSRS